MPGERPVVVFINHWAKNLGGAEHSLMDILACIAPRCQAHLITSEPGPLVDKAIKLGVTSHIVPCSLMPGGKEREHVLRFAAASWRGLASYFRFVFHASRLVKRIGPGCVHANVPKSHMALFLIALLGYRGKCCFHVREIFKRGSMPYRAYRLLFPRDTGACIAISLTVKEHMPPGMRYKARVIYNGVVIPPAIIANVDYKELRFVYLGRVVPWKGCHLLVEMFARAREKFPDANISLTLAGDTLYWSQDYREQLRKRVRELGLSSSCFLLPYTDNPYDELRRHHVFCNASIDEPFGRSIAEAQAVGLPVVAFDSGAVREIVEHGQTGLLAPYNDSDGFVHAMGRFIGEQGLVRSMGKKGYLRAKEMFNRDIQAPVICDHILGG